MKNRICLLIGLVLLQAAFASEYPISDGPIVPGEWNSNYRAAYQYAIDNNIPFIAIVSKYPAQCHFCSMFHDKWTCDEFLQWAKERKPVLGAFYTKSPDGTDSSWVDWVAGKAGAAGSVSGFPMIRIYWQKSDGTVVWDRFMGRQSSIGDVDGDKSSGTVMDFIARLEKTMGSYSSTTYTGGSFELDETEGNRLEAEDGTGEISFNMVRSGDSSSTATTNIVKVVGPDGLTAQEITVDWSVGETNRTVVADMSKVRFAKHGDKALLVLADADGAEISTNTVTYIADSGKSPVNPLWIGERKAVSSRSDVPVLEYGEWTMDLGVAKEKVANEDGDAYTLVAVEGSLWCPDCANTERNFTGVKDAKGENRLSAWAASNKVALVTVDIPNFSTNSIECASPTLLSRKAFVTTLARAREYPASGADPSLTNAMARSGLGYLTRKGVSDDRAYEVLSNNWRLVTTLYSDGGLRSATDTNKYRTGVPIFVLLDKSGNVRARLTRFAAKSPYLEDAGKWDDIIKRFDEMLEMATAKDVHADDSEIANDDASTTTLSFRASGGSASGEISHADFQDVFRLEGVDGNVLQKVVVTGACDSVVAVQFMKLDADGRSQAVGSAVSGVLSESFSLEETFTEPGDYFVKISGGNIASGDFAVDSPKAGNFAAYSVSGAVVLVPQETRASGAAPQDSNKVVMRLEEGRMYRIEGIDPASVANVLAANTLDPYCKFYTALASGDFELTVAYGNGGAVTYQKWVASQIGFASQSETVKESVGSVSVGLVRTGGVSGEVVVRVSLDEDATTFYDGEGIPRFEFDDTSITWKDGESFRTNVVINIMDDIRFDGSGDVALKLELESDENGDTVMTATNFVLTVKEDDKQAAGKVAFTGAEPFFSKKDTVYAKASDGATLYAERLEASDGYVSAQVKVSGDATVEVGGKVTNVVVWANHKYEKQAVRIAGIPAGKSATAILEKPTDGLKVVTASSKVKVVSVADDAPEFESDSDVKSLCRYVSVSNFYPVVFCGGVDPAKATLSFNRLSGTLPAGLTAKCDAAGKGLSIFGIPTAKAGIYTLVYQVVQKVGTTATPGLTMALTYEISDPSSASGEDAVYNAAVAACKSRTFKDVPVVDKAAKRLVGVLQITLPQTGKASAKLACAAGTVSFSAKGWSEFAADGDKSLSAVLASAKEGYSLSVVAKDDGSVLAAISMPDGEAEAVCDGRVWSKDDPADAWSGYYTVALMNTGVSETKDGVAPRGNGYLTLDMTKKGDRNSGTVKWAGKLPDGTAVKGSAVLGRDGECLDVAALPVYGRSSTDILAALVSLCTNGLVQCDASVDAHWSHSSKYAETCYTVELNAYGRLYDSTTNLAAACQEGYETVSPKLTFDLGGLSDWLSVGTPSAENPSATVSVGEKTLTVDKNNVSGATLNFNRSTGVVSGTFKLPYTKTGSGESKTMSAKYSGVVLIGWGEGCGCDREGDEVYLPFVVGAFTIDDSVSVSTETGGLAVKVKRGGAAKVDK